MNYEQFLNRVVDEGKEAARLDYKSGDKLAGSQAGFEACRGKGAADLAALLDTARAGATDARRREAADYWWFRCYELEVEWVCNCVSAMFHNQKLPTIVPPTCRGAIKAAEILGVGGVGDGAHPALPRELKEIFSATHPAPTGIAEPNGETAS